MSVLTESPSAVSVFDNVLHRATAGEPARLTVHGPAGVTHVVDAAAWVRPALPGDQGLLDRCDGPTLDVGCGPGRLTRALTGPGRPALGVDVSAVAVRLARERGASALRRDVFSALPGHGRWRHLLLADGNIGIGGDPGRLLRRCRDLLARSGRVHAELAPPGTPSWSGRVRVSVPGGAPSEPFGWAMVAADDLAPLAAANALRVLTTWKEAGRWFASLERA
ncbi:class I SAM-dependent methyltransferase [Symbioplanes lichenis]|uniref:class I SAM-dependent methyltransferase n=1 Tax=Symbioplanes lichenis TaxID=1629072 RepID=UPI002738F314|nr:class I SAM-dependent methyltransferase [Actinoplanes lichenis]